jgi:hypothetical protein
MTLTAGPPPTTISLQIHLSVLSRHSEYFQRIIKPEWASMRPDPSIIDMGPAHSAIEVAAYAHWLYSGTIPTRDFDHVGGAKSDAIWCDLVCLSCVRERMMEYVNVDDEKATFYVFAEKILDQAYKRAILATIAAVQRDAPDFPCAEAFAIIYEGTPEGSPARRLLVDMYAYGADDAADWSREFELLPHEALVDIMRAMVKVRRENGARPWTEGLEAYEEK